MENPVPHVHPDRIIETNHELDTVPMVNSTILAVVTGVIVSAVAIAWMIWRAFN